MTREEAIEILECNYPESCFKELCEAVDMAMEALSTDSKLVEKILEAGKEGKEVRIYIGGRLFAVRELAQ